MRICQPGYRPTLTDVLRCTIHTSKRVGRLHMPEVWGPNKARGTPITLFDVDLPW